MRQSHVHPDERGPGEHADGGGREREGEVGGHHRGVADEQDPEKSFFLDFCEFFFVFFRETTTSFFFSLFLSLPVPKKNTKNKKPHLFLSLSDLLALSPAGAASAA